MSCNRRFAQCSADDVWSVLADGWQFAAWVVGASRVRSVEPGWPAAGSVLHHSFGAWPAVIDDVSTVLDGRAPTRLVLRAEGWPLGAAEVRLDVEPAGVGCRITLREEAVSGPGSWIPSRALDPVLHLRNRETLRRLVLLAEGRSRR